MRPRTRILASPPASLQPLPRRLLLLLLFLVSLLLSQGCSTSSGPSDSLYLSPTSPERVLANFVTAYQQMDVEELMDCLSDDYRFYFTEQDQQDFPQLPPWWYKSDEQQVHENMFDTEGDVSEVRLTLTPTHVETLPGWDTDGRGDVVVITTQVDLRVYFDDDMIWLATSPSEFHFRRIEGSCGCWEMCAWHDLEDYDRVEDAGWGGIKYMFLDHLTHETDRATPAEVIEQLETAYATMDLEPYLDCLAEDFVFYPNEEDVQGSGGEIPPEWYKADETAIHENMFSGDPQQGPVVDHIQIALAIEETQHDTGPDPGDPSDDTYVLTVDVNLRLHLQGGVIYLTTLPSEFTIAVDADQVGPYGDLMWDVREWYEAGYEAGPSSPPDGARAEDATWGGIKALYR